MPFSVVNFLLPAKDTYKLLVHPSKHACFDFSLLYNDFVQQRKTFNLMAFLRNIT